MDKHGRQMKHGKVVGYVVECATGLGGVVTACHGYGDDSPLTVLLFGDHATLFKTRRQAQGFIDDSKVKGPDRRFVIRSVHPLA